MAPETLLSVRNLATHFNLDEGNVVAVDSVSFDVPAGKTLAVVGESGCGKSVTARSILRIIDMPGHLVAGEILFRRSPKNGQPEKVVDLAQLDPDGHEIRGIRGDEIALIFQEPMAAFSPVHTIGTQLIEAIRLHNDVSKAEAREIGIESLRQVGVPLPEQRIDAYAFELSGGLCQRAMIAIALSCNPDLLIADEPTTALDVTTQAQILDLLRRLKDSRNMAMMLITHDLGVVAETADIVVVMYLGRVVETATVDDIFHNAKHPYTISLLESIPSIFEKSGQRLKTIKGSVPHPLNKPAGCPFHPRCPSFIPGTCEKIIPGPLQIAPGHKVSCHLYPAGEDKK
jgi:oligopeptide/dipeptide ABC transporter ATP-binding protein